jgi:hypothetical protein
MTDTRPKTTRGFAMDGMSRANFQALKGRPSASAAAPANARAETYVARADSLSTANLQSLAHRTARTTAAAPAVAPANAKAAASPPAKPVPSRPPGRQEGRSGRPRRC